MFLVHSQVCGRNLLQLIVRIVYFPAGQDLTELLDLVDHGLHSLGISMIVFLILTLYGLKLEVVHHLFWMLLICIDGPSIDFFQVVYRNLEVLMRECASRLLGESSNHVWREEYLCAIQETLPAEGIDQDARRS